MNRGLKQKGFSLIELLVVVILIGIIAALAIPSLLASRRAANEASAISNLRNVHTAQNVYNKNTNAYGTFANLSAAALLDSTWTGSPTKSGFLFVLTLGAGNAGFCATATAVSAGAANRSFAISHDGVIYQMTGQTAPTCDAATGAMTGDATLKVFEQ